MNQEWRTRAACRGKDPAWWETPPSRSGKLTRPLVEAARRGLGHCGTCPVRYECELDAEASEFEPIGVIRAGTAYNHNGIPARPCGYCEQPILSRKESAEYCCNNCANSAAYHAARTERLAA